MKLEAALAVPALVPGRPTVDLSDDGVIAPSHASMTPAAQAALRGMVEENFAFIWRVLRRVGVPAQAVDDAAQQVFYVAARKIDAITPEKARSFLVGTALRIAAEVRRSGARREVVSDELDDEIDDALSPEEQTERRRELAFLDGVLGAMTFELQTVFVLFEIEGLSTHDIAPALGIPRGTVASRLRRAREEFLTIAKRSLAKERGGVR